ncbi:MAG: DNA-deoxyinosine glycosylase [Clostridia bacterium]|nr:DNA-deoxyinosine glycosylase [Clostridia bacterium]
MERQVQRHPIEPVYDRESRVLILGSFPSVRSREEGFFYGHPQNRFWRVLAAVFDTRVPETVEEKRAFLLEHHIALWDVIASCTVAGSSDSSIRDVVPNELEQILSVSPIERIYVNGKAASRFYDRYQKERTGREAVCLPSTSPANAAWSLDGLTEAWRSVKP